MILRLLVGLKFYASGVHIIAELLHIMVERWILMIDVIGEAGIETLMQRAGTTVGFHD